MIEEILIFGTVQGALLALLALGFSLVYGVGGILNLAHGAFFLITAYMIYWTIPFVGFWMAAVIGLATVVGIGAFTYLGLMKPLQESHIGIVLVTFALAFFFEQFVKFVGDPKTHYIVPFVPGTVTFLGISFPAQFIALIVGSLILVTSVTIFINKSTIGKSIRAVSQDFEAAKLVGINTDMVLMTTVMISALLVGFAAVLYAPGNFIAPRIGWRYLLLAFSVTIFGGMGSIPGSIVGAFVMGYATSLTDFLISPTFSVIIPIVVILVMLLVRPQGLLGKKELH
ncbi:MAG: High-affinity branched-chain amino acid transport system permease protein LivH [Candidatus Thorarchaeota archaeon AB_25]|nr:MAG: High-affinity branched-chain amino acid transport system permease protein LivH [Candidatus Thorarchaeota archaeon AB_25]